MKILVLRIYNADKYYDQMKDLHMKYDDSIFVTYCPTLESEWEIDGRMIKIRGNESYMPGILEKTLKAIEICLENFEFDYLVRSNMSMVIDLKELESKIKNTWYGGHIFNLTWTCEFSGITPQVLEKLYGLQFISGSCIVYSRNLCKYIVEQGEQCDRSLADDVSLGLLLRDTNADINIPFREGIPAIVEKCCFYRYRDFSEDRSQNIIDMEAQYKLLLEHHTRNDVHCL